MLDGSLIGMFVLYGINDTLATSATIVYHAISLWIPATWGTIAFLLLRRSRNQPVIWLPERVRRGADLAGQPGQRPAAGFVSVPEARQPG